MKKLLMGLVAGLCLVSAGFAADSPRRERAQSDDMRRAIEFQRAKDRADARQARREARHPSVQYDRNSANRTDESEMNGRTVNDPGERKYRDHRK